MSDLSVSSKNIHSIHGLDKEDLNLLMSGLYSIIDNLDSHDQDKAADLLEVMK